MKSKKWAAALCAAAMSLMLCAFTFEADSSVKELTKPYITTYECTEARLGDEDLMEKYEYIKITFLDSEQLEVSMKRKDGKRQAYRCDYTYDDETDVFCAEIGILGFRYRQETRIQNGQFSLAMPISGKLLFMNFAS